MLALILVRHAELLSPLNHARVPYSHAMNYNHIYLPISLPPNTSLLSQVRPREPFLTEKDIV
jgi:hypothetical protein